MTSQPVEANVVLTADNSGYDQAMAASSQATTTLMSSVDALTAKIGKLTKTAGKSLIGIAAGDVAMITGATAAWSSYEKQMERLKSQAAVLGRSTDQQNKLMKDYSNTVKGLRSEFGTTTTEAAKLAETLSKVTNVRQSRDLGELSKVFIQMSKATGESSEGLASSLTNLEKIMGTPVNAQNSRKYADTFTHLAAQTNVSAQGLMDFTATLAPVAKSLGMNTKQVAGFATAFTQAGQDTGAASLMFTKVSRDMLRSLQSGSPELATYANIVGTTTENFKKLAKSDASEAVIRVFEALSRNTKTASADIERLGLDGPRTIRAIAGLTNQPGGIRAAAGLVNDPSATGSVERGYKATLSGLSNQFDELREDLKQTAEAFATILGPAMEGFLAGLEKAASIMQSVVQGPIGKFLQVVMGLVAPLAGGAGALLLFAGALVKVAGAFLLLKNSMTRGLVEGFQGKAGIIRSPEGVYMARGGGTLGKTGANLVRGTDPNLPREEQSSWVQRGLYNIGQFGGSGLSAFRSGGAVPEHWYEAREALSSKIPWTQQYARPDAPRSALSAVSRGAGALIENFVTPTFDQMRHAGPSQRRTWAAQEAPWVRAGDAMEMGAGRVKLIPGLAAAMGRVGMADTRLQAQREETTRVHQDPLMDEQSRQARLTELRGMREETMQRKNAALAQETAIRQEIAQRGESARVTAEANRETKTFGQAMRGLGGAVGGSLLTGGKDVARLAWRSGMVGQAGAMGAAVAGGAMGSNMLMMGGTGAMIGSMIPGVGTALGGAVGATAGLAMDAAKANNDVTDSIKELNQQATDAGKSGSGLAALAEATDQSKKKFQDYNKSMTALRQPGLSPLQSITTGYGQAKNFVEGLLGDSDVEEQAKKLNVTADKARNVADAFRDLAKAGGVKLTGSATAQRQQLDEFMASRGLPALGQANIELPDLIAARAKGGPQYQDMLDKAITPGKATGMWDRMRTTQVGAAMLDSPQMRKSLQFQNDIALAYDATNSVFEKMRKTGMSYLDIVKSAEKTQAQIGVEGGPEYSRAAALSQKAEYAIQMQAPQMGRIGAVQSQLALTQAVLATKPKTDTDAAEREAQKQAAASAIADQDQYFRSMILAQRAYERSRVRAQEDFSLQRQYQEYDYNMSRTRAEENFNRMRARAIADYHRSVTRAWSDFNLQRKRQEQDYQHQIEVTAQQRAISMNLYQRPETQRTSSATWLLSNTSKILSNLRTQKQHLNELRKLGFSDAVIQQLQLTDPNNAQELARFVAEVRTDRTMVGRFNRVAGQLSRASRALVTDSSSLDFKEMQRSFLQGRDRGMADMNRSMDRQHADFWRGLGQQRTDFNIMMDQQAQDYENQNNRQLKQYQTSMHRSAQDMAHMADEVTGSITDVLVTAHEELTGSAKKQAGLALKSFQDLRKSTKPEAVALMRELSQIFGFEYTNPLKGHGPAPIPSASNAHSGRTAGGVSRFDAAHPGMAQGGVVPGWSPGRDDKMVPVSGGEAVMRPEWARRVGKVAIDAMNHAAAHGGYAKGGIVWPLPSSNWSTYPGHDGIDLNAPNDLGKPFYAAAPGRISYTGWGHGYGDAIFETGPYGTLVYGHGSKVAVHAGQRVTAGQYIGNVGSTGHSTGPHLHIGFPGGTSGEILSFLHGAGHTGYGAAAPLGGLIDPLALTGVLKDRYPQAEKAAYNMDGVHPLNPGMISAIINRLGRRVAAKYARRAAPGGVNVVNLGNEPASNLTNEGIVHVGANRLGWGDQWPSLRQLVMHESGFNNLAQNPSSTAFGMFQFLNSTWAGVHGHKTADPWKQTQYGLQYIKDRYGNPAHAWDMWQSRSPHWYADGAVFNSPRQIGVGEGGPEAVIPLNQKGGEFLARSIGLDSAPMAGGSVSVANYRIDRSTNFTGPITVQANDPNELLAKLQARQRVRALTKPALSGSAA